MSDTAIQQATVGVEKAVEAALTRREGLVLLFAFSDYEDVDECRKAAMRFRLSYYRMRTVARKAKDFDTRTRYDNLACFLKQTSKGWQIILKPDINVVRVIGDPVEEWTPEHHRWVRLQVQATECMRRKAPSLPCPFSEEDVAFFWAHNAQQARAVYEDLGWPIPGEPTEPEFTSAEDLFGPQ